MRRCLTSLTTKEMQIKTRIGYYFTFETGKTKKPNNTDRDVKEENSCITNVFWTRVLEDSSTRFHLAFQETRFLETTPPFLYYKRLLIKVSISSQGERGVSTIVR